MEVSTAEKRLQWLSQATGERAVGSLFLPRPRLNRREEALPTPVNDRCTGLRLEHIITGTRAASEKRVGVVVIAAGDKSAILLGGLRRGLVNHAPIDQVQAAALARALRSGSKAAAEEPSGGVPWIARLRASRRRRSRRG